MNKYFIKSRGYELKVSLNFLVITGYNLFLFYVNSIKFVKCVILRTYFKTFLFFLIEAGNLISQ